MAKVETARKETDGSENRFTDRQREHLQALGYIILDLEAKSIKDLKAEGVQFWSTWHADKPLELEKSRQGQVAVKAKNMFLTGSGKKTVEEQDRIINSYGENLSEQVPGTEAVMGSPADNLNVAVEFAKAAHKPLFRYAGSFDVSSTNMVSDGGHHLFVGASYDGGLFVAYHPDDSLDNEIKVLPLIIPAKI